MRAAAFLFCTLGFTFIARADVINYSCDGVYHSRADYNPYDPSTVSVSAHLEAVLLRDGGRKNQYILQGATLKMTAIDQDGKDAGSLAVGETEGRANRARKPKFKSYIRFDIGSNLGQAYIDSGNTPETYLLIPSAGTKVVYVQRTGSGHDVYPTIRLNCK